MVLLAALCCTAIAMSAQTIVPAGPGAPNRVHLIFGTEASFDTLVSQHLPDIAASPHFQAMKATSVVVANDTPFAVRAIALKWVVTQADGTEATSYTCICPEPAGRVLLPGRRAALLPSHVALASPLAHAEEGAVAGHAVNAALMNSVFTNVHAGIAPDVLSAQKIGVTIDAIVFGNGVVAGPDTFGLQEKFVCERNGAIAEAQSLGSLVGSPDALRQQLNSDAAVRNNAALGACTMSRAREARRLLDLQETRGEKALITAIQQLENVPALSLHRAK
jgi:hypothetical protein